MIAYLRGKILQTNTDTLLLDVGGVGYELHCSSNTLDELAALAARHLAAGDLATGHLPAAATSNNLATGDLPTAKGLNKFYVANKTETCVWVYTYVREDCLQLFGFSQVVERSLFLSLIKVKGVGPKMALQILSATSPQQVAEWIDQGDVKALTALPKVGKKTAEQMILTLKGELVVDKRPVFSARSEIVSALLNLGFKSTEVEHVVSQLKPTPDVQQGVREALAALS